MKRCHYEVLEVDRKATPAEIKTSYRKMALKYHPDKNSEEGSKERFVQINEAYNVLSDPNERTWYDNNREKLLFNKEDMSKEDLDQFTFGFNIYHYFTTGCFKGYDDADGGFFAVYRDVFEKIKAEEAKAFSHREDLTEELRKYEGFGDSTTNEDRVLRFYEDWENFSTYKTFVWSEEWDTREANCRWARREMEKENKKVRQGERKTYVKTIKDLLAYVRKRDPRFINYLTRCREEEERKQQEKLEREKEKKREKEEMKVVKQRLEEERFREIEEYYRKQNELSNTSTPTVISHKPARGKPEEEEQGEFYCEICEKEFKSENQLRNHEKSKQHKQMVKDIEREVLLKEEILQKANEEEETQSPDPVELKEEPSPAKKKKNKKKKNQQQQQQEQQKQEDESQPEETKPEPKKEVEVKQETKKQAKQETKKEVKQEAKKEEKQETKQEEKQQKKAKQQKKQESSSQDEEHFMNTLLGNRSKKNQVKPAPQQSQPAPKADKKKAVKVEQSEEEDEQEEARLGKAKLKKQKRAQQEKSGKAAELKCKGCNETFPSKTKLFEHINKTGHASAK